jgi:predicted MFS family arabinose efflux permease
MVKHSSYGNWLQYFMQASHPNNNTAILIAGILSLVIGVGVARFAFTSLLPSMLEDSLDLTFAGILASVNFIGYLSGSILAIFISNLHTKIRLFRLGILLSILTTIVLGITQNEIAWILARIVAGFGAAMILVVGSAIVMTQLNLKDKTRAMGIHFSGIGFSILLSDLVARAFMSMGGTWQQAWLGLALFAAILAPFVLRTLSIDQHARQNIVHHRLSFSVFTPLALLLIVAYFTEGVGFVVQGTFLPDIINSVEGLEGYGGHTWLLVGIAGIPSSILWMRLAHRYGSINMIIVAMLLQVVGILIPTLTHHPLLNLLSGILYGGTFVGLVALFLNLGGRIAGKNPVVLMGALTSAYGIGQVSAPLYSVALTEHFGSYDTALYLTAAITGAGAILMLLGRKIRE